MRPSYAYLAVAGLVALLALPPSVSADNNHDGTPYALAIGGTPAEATIGKFGTPEIERRYFASVVATRSYCVETQGGVHFDTNADAGTIGTFLTVYRADKTTLIGANDDVSFNEPGGGTLSRICFVAPATERAYIVVSASNVFTAFNVRVRIVETTLFSNWFFLGGDYGAYTIIRNTTSAPVAVTVRWRSLTGTQLNTFNTTIAANGGAFLNARDFVSDPATNQTGNVEITHAASPQAIMATATVLSASTGLSFDTIFTQRQPW